MATRAMKINYFSSGPRERVLEALLASRHEVEGLFVTDPDRWPGVKKTIEIAEKANLSVRIIKRPDIVALGEELAGQVCLSVAFVYLFPPEFLQHVGLCLNVHGSLLPQYAGARTLNWTLVDGETRSGVTVHKVDSGIDTGDILLQKSFPLSGFDTARSLARKTLEFEPSVVVEALDGYETGALRFVPQDASRAVLKTNRSPANSELNSSIPLRDLVNKIRASDPDRYPAYFFLNGEKVCIRLWRPDKPEAEFDLI